MHSQKRTRLYICMYTRTRTHTQHNRLPPSLRILCLSAPQGLDTLLERASSCLLSPSPISCPDSGRVSWLMSRIVLAAIERVGFDWKQTSLLKLGAQLQPGPAQRSPRGRSSAEGAVGVATTIGQAWHKSLVTYGEGSALESGLLQSSGQLSKTSLGS